MELTEPHRKKTCRLKPAPSLPVSATNQKFRGKFDGLSVTIQDTKSAKELASKGCFGKANLSRTFPHFEPPTGGSQIVRRRVWNSRKKMGPLKKPGESRKVIVVPDSDSNSDQDIGDYFTNLRPEFQLDSSGLCETLNLALEEAFFLSIALECLTVFNEKGRVMGYEEMLKCFSEADEFFLENYVAYYHFRAKNWVVKSGIKFGGDFLLYKQGPAYYHASYVVVIEILNKVTARKTPDTISLLGLNRLCETSGKEVLICQILWPQIPNLDYRDLSQFTVKELLLRRWLSNQEREAPKNE